VLGGFVQGVSASPIFDSSAADVWVVDADGVTQGSYSVGEGAWTLSASPTTLTEAKVSVVAAPDALIPFQMASGGGVIVNQAAHSYPNVMGGSLGFSLKGLEAAASSLVDPMQPSVSIDPVGGFYENTLRVLLVALPGATNPEPVMLHWRVGEGALQSVEASEASFFLFEPGDHVVQYHVSQGVGHATAPVTETYQIDPAIDRMRDSDADGLPDAW